MTDLGDSAMREIKPIGLRIIDHPRLAEWTTKGWASQESDGLWLHYTVICTLLHEAVSLSEGEIEELARAITESLPWNAEQRARLQVQFAGVLRERLGGKQ